MSQIHSSISAPWIYTYTGQKVNLYDPDPDTIKLTDIAHGLSNICRWGGQASMFYSVAQHSVMVSKMCKTYPMLGLFHDASEAYLGDICRPLKRSPSFNHFRELEQNLLSVIQLKFCGTNIEVAEVKEADEQALVMEAEQLMGRSFRHHDEWLCDYGGDVDQTPLRYLPPEYARQAFFLRYYRLSALNEGVSP